MEALMSGWRDASSSSSLLKSTSQRAVSSPYGRKSETCTIVDSLRAKWLIISTMLRQTAPDAFAPTMIASLAVEAPSLMVSERAVTVGAIVSCGCACTVSAMIAPSLTSCPKKRPAPSASRSRSLLETAAAASSRSGGCTVSPAGLAGSSAAAPPLGLLGRFESIMVVMLDIVSETCLPTSSDASASFFWICCRSRSPQSPFAN
mmetsp:Transcript_42015/g.136330  ORF Transcript_42015/g.136330 Transcript_42015/m.136330 type:complete len:204 (+) Transcript_42015:980-1591(+)